LSPGLLAQDINLAIQNESDVPFLRRLYLSVRWEELAPTGWNDAQKTAFLESQFAAQYRHYALVYAEAVFHIIRHGAEPIGRVVIFSNDRDIRIVDIALLPEWRGRGIGTDLLKTVFAKASAAKQIVSIHVEQFNPAKTLYTRLGFRKCGEHGPYWLMEWKAEQETVN